MTPGPGQLRDVDLGHEGIAGFYLKFIGQLGRAIGDAIVIAGAGLYLLSLPPNVDYQVTATISATLLVKLALALWALKTLWTLARALWNAARWIGLESRGMQWAEQGGEMLRVTFYRSRDQIMRCDETPKARRLAEDAAGRRYRWHATWFDGGLLGLFAVCYIYMPLALAYVHDWLGETLQGDFDRWDVARLVRLIFLLFVIVPRAVDFLMVLVESVIHGAGAQFMPGAKVRDV